MRRLPGPAVRRLSKGVPIPEALSVVFRDWQRTQTQSSVTALRGPRQQMDVWFCREEPTAERHHCADECLIRRKARSPERANGNSCFSLDFDWVENRAVHAGSGKGSTLYPRSLSFRIIFAVCRCLDCSETAGPRSSY